MSKIIPYPYTLSRFEHKLKFKQPFHFLQLKSLKNAAMGMQYLSSSYTNSFMCSSGESRKDDDSIFINQFHYRLCTQVDSLTPGGTERSIIPVHCGYTLL